MMADPGNRGSAKVLETMRADVSSSICLAAEPRKPSRPAATSLHEQAGYTTASTGIAVIEKFPCKVEVVHTRRSVRASVRRRGLLDDRTPDEAYFGKQAMAMVA